MFKKSLILLACLASFGYADNFIIDSYYGGGSKGGYKHLAQDNTENPADKLPQRMVVEDINPSSDLGKLVTTMLKNEQKKAAVAAKPKPKPKVAAKKKPVKKPPKKKVAKKPAPKKEPAIEVKTEEASKLPEHDKKEAEHNENNSSLKKISSSNICD